METSTVCGFLIISEENLRGYTFEECYHWVICVFKVDGDPRRKRFFKFRTRTSWVWKGGIFVSVETDSALWATEERVVSSQNFPLSWEALRLWYSGATRNVLTWNELGGLCNLLECARSRFIGRNSFECELHNVDSVGGPFLF